MATKTKISGNSKLVSAAVDETLSAVSSISTALNAINVNGSDVVNKLVDNVNKLSEFHTTLNSLNDIKLDESSDIATRTVIASINAVVAELTSTPPPPSSAPTVLLVLGELEHLRLLFQDTLPVVDQATTNIGNVIDKLSTASSKMAAMRTPVSGQVDGYQRVQVDATNPPTVTYNGIVSADVSAYVDAVTNVSTLISNGFNTFASADVVNNVVNVNNGISTVMDKLNKFREARTVKTAAEASIDTSSETMKLIDSILRLENVVGDNEVDVSSHVVDLVKASTNALETQQVITNVAAPGDFELTNVVTDLNLAVTEFANFVPNAYKQQADIVQAITNARIERLSQRLDNASTSSDGVDYDDMDVTTKLAHAAINSAPSIVKAASDTIDTVRYGKHADAAGEFVSANKALLRNAMFANSKLANIKSNLLRGPVTPTVMRSMLSDAAVVVENVMDAQLNVLRNVDVATGSVPMNGVHSAKRSLELVDGLLSSLEHVQRDNPATKSLMVKRRELVTAIGNTEKMMSATADMAKIMKTVKNRFTLTLGMLAAGASMMGIGALVSTFTNPLSAAAKVNDRYEANGRVYAGLAMVDGAAGLGVDRDGARELGYTYGKKYHDMTYGSIGFDAVANYYSSLMTGVGGHYGSTQAAARDDARSFAESTFAVKTVTGMSDQTVGNFYKVFYKDMGESASAASGQLARLVDVAHAGNVPVETYVNTISQLADGLRSAGVSADRVAGAVGALVKGGLRVEDAESITRSTAAAGGKLSSNWSSSIFYGAVLGKGGSMFQNVSDSQLSHTADGKPREAYYNSMVDRIFGQTNFMMDVFGGTDSAVGNVAAADQLKQLGYSAKDTSIIMSTMKSGGRDAVRDKLKEVDAANDPMALPTSTEKMNELLAMAGSQHAETTKILADLDSAINDTAFNLDKSLHGPLADVGNWFSKLIDEFERMAANVIDGIGGFLGSGFGKFVLDHFADSPFLTTGVAVGASALALTGARRLITGSAGTLPSTAMSALHSIPRSSTRARMLAVGALGLTSLMAASTAMAATPGDILNQTLTDGTAVVQVTNWSDLRHILALTGVAVLGVAAAVLLRRFGPGLLRKLAGRGGLGRLGKLTSTLGRIPRGARMFGINALLAGVNTLGRDDLSTTEALEVTTIDATGMTAGEYAGSRVGGLLGRTGASLFGARGRALAPLAEKAGSLIGGVGGQIAGGSAAEWFEQLLGVGGTLTQRSTEEGESYEDMARRLGMSNEDFTKMMQLSLSDHGLKVTDLNADQKRYWMKTFNSYMEIYGSIAAAAVAAANNMANSTVNQQEVYNKVDAAWANDDSTKGSWFERRAKEFEAAGDTNKASEYRHMANYYYHSNDDENSEYWSSEAENLQAVANGDDEDAKNYWTAQYAAWLRHNMASLDGKHSQTLAGATKADVKLFMKWLAERSSASERKVYDETVGNEEYQKALKQRSSAMIRRGGSLDIMTPHFTDVNALQSALDARGVKLDANVVVAVCKEKGLDPVFLTASICQENGNQGQYNYGNVKGDGPGGYRSYDSQADGVRGAANTWVAIAREEHTSDFASIANVYAEDPNYVKSVTDIMSEITGSSVSAGTPGNFMNVQAQGAFTSAITDEQYNGMTNPTKQFLNVLSERFFKQTGVKVTLTSGYRPDDVGSYHSQGIAFDVTADEFEGENGLAFRNAYTALATEMGGDALDEYPGGEGEQYARGNNIHVSVHNQDGAFLNKAGATSMLGKFTAPKPQTLAEQSKSAMANYEAIMTANGAHAISGKIVNGMYVDAGQQYESAATIREAANASTLATYGDVAGDLIGTERALFNRLSIAPSDESVQRKSNFDVILARTHEITGEYMDNPSVVANCTYASKQST